MGLEQDRNQPDDVLASLAEQLKADFGTQDESSLKDETNDISKPSNDEGNENKVIEQENTEKNSEAEESQEQAPSLDTKSEQEETKEEAQTDTPVEFTKEQYEELQKKYEELANKQEESTSTVPDLTWLRSEEGRLWATDFDNYDLEENAVELAAQKIMDEKGFSYDQAYEELEDLYPEIFEEDADTDSREYRRAERNILAAATKQLETLKARQKEIEVPFTQSESKGEQIAKEDFDNVYKERLVSDYQQRAQARAQIADNLVKGKETVSIKLGDVEMEYNLSQEVKDKIKSDIVDIENIGSQFANKDGSINQQELLEFFIWKNDRQTLADIYANIKSAETKEKVIKDEIKNSNFDKKNPQVKTINMPEDHPLYEATMALKQQGG